MRLSDAEHEGNTLICCIDLDFLSLSDKSNQRASGLCSIHLSSIEHSFGFSSADDCCDIKSLLSK